LVLALMGVPLLCALVAFAARPAARTPWLAPARASTTCLLPRAQMRYQHMTHLKALRDRVVRQGLRAEVTGVQPQGLSSCRNCHAQRELFCDRCHEQAGVSPDCFGCHVY
jgi:hypothetical protein